MKDTSNSEIIVLNYFDGKRGWADTNKGWYEVLVPVIEHWDKHRQMVKWLYENIDNPERHARWIMFDFNSGFKFRYQRDYIMFTLRWL